MARAMRKGIQNKTYQGEIMAMAIEQKNLGQAAFTKNALAFYDWFVLKMTCRYVWRCPNEDVLAFYQQHLTGNHLEVGVGTGYFLDHSVFPVSRPRVGLLDLNANCLERTATRIARHTPEIYQASVLDPIELNAPRFDSIGLNYVLHCLPGAFPEKGIVFAHLKALLNPGGVIFGSTVLGGGIQTNPLASVFLRFFNARQILCNQEDVHIGLVLALEQHLKDVRVEMRGAVALFSGRV